MPVSWIWNSAAASASVRAVAAYEDLAAFMGGALVDVGIASGQSEIPEGDVAAALSLACSTASRKLSLPSPASITSAAVVTVKVVMARKLPVSRNGFR
jgi:hypothetical protein